MLRRKVRPGLGGGGTARVMIGDGNYDEANPASCATVTSVSKALCAASRVR